MLLMTTMVCRLNAAVSRVRYRRGRGTPADLCDSHARGTAPVLHGSPEAMLRSIRRMLWVFLAALAVLITLGVLLTTLVLQRQKREDFVVLQVSQPMIESATTMNREVLAMLAASRGFLLTGNGEFLQQYNDATRAFDTAATRAYRLAGDARNRQLIVDYRRHFTDLRSVVELQMTLAREGKQPNALEAMAEAARLQRLAPDYSGMIIDDQKATIASEAATITSLSQWLVVAMILGAALIMIGAVVTTARVDRSLIESVRRETRRTHAMISGMSDGVMLIDGEGKTLFINPAGEAILGTSSVGVPMEKHAYEYGMRTVDGTPLGDFEIPAVRALATGRPIEDVTMRIVRDDRDLSVAMSAVPLHEEGALSFVVVTFRDITERKHLERQLQVQAANAQTIADAGAHFTSNIDPEWVVQAIAEKAAPLSDWAAVILLSGNGPALKIAAIHHRDPALQGLAWSYMERQPLINGEGVIGQVVSTGVPSLISEIGPKSESIQQDKVVSLLVLPLQTRREMQGALVIAANTPERAMTEPRIEVAEAIAERAALAIDNSRLYTEQVEARRKVEDLSRLKDEFLSIASHELRTPVTSIKGYTQLSKTLIREKDLETAEEYLGIALDQIDRMSRLILELLDVSRIETGRLEIRREVIEWGSFVRNIVDRLNTALGERNIVLDVPADTRVVIGDRDRLEQVLGNLLENAVKYSPDGSDVHVNVEERAEQVVTSVADRGIGIPQDELGQVFERFHRGRQVSSTNYGGLGLGLYITKQIVERHGGTIGVESRHGEGTTFQFTLPAANDRTFTAAAT
jgi:signal transduction histidine kinase/CHASE3 domain sensor protein